MKNLSGLSSTAQIRLLSPDFRINHRTLTSTDREWPSVLAELGSDAPKRLFASGCPLDPDSQMLAIVGSRRPTAVGIEMAEQFGSVFAEAGFVVISGLATGIDAIAHKAALAAGGTTVAVVGCGLDVSYPQRNEQLRRMIDQRGTVLSEYDPGMPPLPHHFPSRNRIVAGLAMGVLVVEGSERSGALITARLGLDYNRAVFAIPGSPWNQMAAAPNQLIRSARASLVTKPEHVFEELATGTAWARQDSLPSPNVPVIEDDDKLVLHVLTDKALSSDRISRFSGLAPARCSMALSRMVVRGFANRSPIGYRITSGGARVLSLFESDDGEE